MKTLKKDIHSIIHNLTCVWICTVLVFMLIVIQSETGTRAQQTIISEDTIWTFANSPHIITGNILVEQGVSLTIEPGVVVKFDGFYHMQIEGILVAEGTENNRIAFTSNKGSPTPGDWDSIKFMSNAQSGSLFNYCNFDYGTNAIDINVLNIAAPNITNCNINHNSQTGLKYFTRASTLFTFNPNNEISNNTITDNSEWGIEIQFNVQIPNANLLVIHNLIENNGAGVSFLVYIGNLTITHNTIIRNDGIGVDCNYNSDFMDDRIINITIQNNIILDNEGNGISLSGSIFSGSRFNTIIIERNTILMNSDVNDQKGGGINFEQLEDNTNIILRHNNIYDNTPYDARNGMEFNIDISNNWWGTTESVTIEEHIYDYNDDFNKGRLNYTPILTQPDPDAPDPSAYLNEPDTSTTPSDTEKIQNIIIPIFLVVIIIVVLIVIYVSKRK